MSIKRLKHHAQNFGQMFCGWELMFDYKRLAELKSGNLKLDILKEKCFFNENEIEPLGIIKGLRNWMVQDLENNNLSVEQIKSAELIVKFQTKRKLGQSIKGSSWADPTPYFIYCTLDCKSVIKTNDKEFTSTYTDKEEWPESYSWVKA